MVKQNQGSSLTRNGIFFYTILLLIENTLKGIFENKK
jgi:hypothetical protein